MRYWLENVLLSKLILSTNAKRIPFALYFIFVWCTLYLFTLILRNNLNFGFTPVSKKDDDAEVRTKKILLWNPFFQSKDWMFGLGGEAFVKHGCAETRCNLTFDKTESDIADAILIYMPSIGAMTHRYPNISKHVRIKQIWVFASLESPFYNAHTYYILKHTPIIFNWTMTYRRESTIPWLYGRKRSSEKTLAPVLSADDFASKRTAAWIVSHCMAKSDRDSIYRSLVELGIDVDVYGKCGSHKCPGEPKKLTLSMEPICYERVLRDIGYKFYLAFENAICNDYVTEKLFYALKFPVVPIVLGGADYGQLLPPNTYLSLAQYDYNVTALAEAIRALSNDRLTYAKMIEDRAGIDFDVEWSRHGFCDLCEALHDEKLTGRSVYYDDIHRWWVRNQCIRRF